MRFILLPANLLFVTVFLLRSSAQWFLWQRCSHDNSVSNISHVDHFRVRCGAAGYYHRTGKHGRCHSSATRSQCACRGTQQVVDSCYKTTVYDSFVSVQINDFITTHAHTSTCVHAHHYNAPLIFPSLFISVPCVLWRQVDNFSIILEPQGCKNRPTQFPG